jgi:hypothetical protein
VVRENVVPVLGEAEAIVSGFEGATADLFRQIMLAWWERFGSTKAGGITKLIMAESCNFPEVASFYYEEVITRAKAMVKGMLERGIARGEFRPLDTVHAVDVVIAPMIMLMMWKHSFGACSVDQIDPQKYLECYSDLWLLGLLNAGAAPADAS